MLPYWLLFAVFALAALASGPQFDGRRRVAMGHPGGMRPQMTVQQRPSAAPFLAAGLLLALMLGLRYQVGGDWGAYARMYEAFRYRDFEDIFFVAGSEPLYSLINWIAIQLGIGIWMVNLICAAIFAAGVVAFAKREPLPWLSILVGVPFLIIVVGMGYTRQSAAIGLFLLALNSLRGGHLLRTVLLVLLATTFHRSAIIVMPLIGLSYAKNRFQVFLLVAAAAIVGYFAVVAPEIDRLTYAYVEQEFQAQAATIRLLMNAVPAAIFLLWLKRFNLNALDRLLWRNIAIAGLLSFVAVFLTTATVALDRLGLYIIPLQMFVFGRLPLAFGKHMSARMPIVMAVILYTSAIQYVWLNHAENARYWLPYRSFIFEFA